MVTISAYGRNMKHRIKLLSMYMLCCKTSDKNNKINTCRSEKCYEKVAGS
jgi:hypothetical protein